MIHDHETATQHPDERQPTFAIPRPAWADEVHVGPSGGGGAVVTHLWTAPTVARGGVFAGEVGAPLQVYVQQLDDLVVDERAATYKTGEPVIFLAEADVELSAAEARRYAAAIVEACDRLDAHQGER